MGWIGMEWTWNGFEKSSIGNSEGKRRARLLQENRRQAKTSKRRNSTWLPLHPIILSGKQSHKPGVFVYEPQIFNHFCFLRGNPTNLNTFKTTFQSAITRRVSDRFQIMSVDSFLYGPGASFYNFQLYPHQI
jgi:hypothetical protein